MVLKHQNAAGVLLDRQQVESALSQLKAIGFPMHKVTVVAQHLNADDEMLNTTEPRLQTEGQFVRHRTIQQIEHGAFDGGRWSSIAGILEGGLVSLAVSGVGSLVLAGETALVGLAAGAFYGAVGGAILGAAIGMSISDEQVQRYREQLAQGHYLIILEGTNNEIQQAEPILKSQGIQDWTTFESL